MNSNFIYLTKKKAILLFLAFQLIPFFLIKPDGLLKTFSLWLGFEIIILGMIFIWQLKPMSEFDEREKSILLKWKGRIIDHGLSVFMIPLFTVCLMPEIEAWTLYCVAALPAYLVFTLYHILMKRELGYYFSESKN
jgi:hypothetical protein